jgi:hypothetical protein
MLKISVIDSRAQRRVVIEGALVEPWMSELRSSWQAAKVDLQGRKLVLDLKNVTRISEEAEGALSELVKEGASICTSGVLTKYLLQQLARKNKQNARIPGIPTFPDAIRGKG